MNKDIACRLAALELRRPQAKPRRIVIIGPHDPEPADADEIIRIVAAQMPDSDATFAGAAS